jgi:hypothetical protein
VEFTLVNPCFRVSRSTVPPGWLQKQKTGNQGDSHDEGL